MADEPKKHILIVDDDPSICRMLGIRLEQEGFKVTSANNGREGVSKTIGENPDLIIMDIQMPEMDGLAASEQIKANQGTKDVPIVFLTGLEKKEEEIEDDNEVAGNIIFAKPYNPEKLVRRIRKILNLDNRISL